MESRSRLSRLADRRKALWLVDRDGSNPREILKDVSYFDWYRQPAHHLCKPGRKRPRSDPGRRTHKPRSDASRSDLSHRIGRVEGWLKPSLHRRRQPFQDESVGAAFAGRPPTGCRCSTAMPGRSPMAAAIGMSTRERGPRTARPSSTRETPIKGTSTQSKVTDESAALRHHHAETLNPGIRAEQFDSVPEPVRR